MYRIYINTQKSNQSCVCLLDKYFLEPVRQGKNPCLAMKIALTTFLEFKKENEEDFILEQDEFYYNDPIVYGKGNVTIYDIIWCVNFPFWGSKSIEFQREYYKTLLFIRETCEKIGVKCSLMNWLDEE